MTTKASTSPVLSLLCMVCLFWSAGAWAQSDTRSNGCPLLPADAVDEFHWVTLQTGSALLCRAVHKESGSEAFALTVAAKSPFKPTSNLREEEGRIHGKKLWWYRGEIAGQPNDLVRETLVKLDSGRVVHAFIRTRDADLLTRYQTVVHGLDFTTPSVAAR